ncbi:MAG: universal stress protein [Chloroflexi bacterium]|nr:universal stress protein [Chloroflexota bacterium]
MFSKILVPLDGSPLAEAILPYASELARRLQAGVVLLTVIDDAESSTFPGASREAGSGAEARSEMARSAEAQANDYLRGVAGGLPVSADVIVSVGKPEERIIEAQEQNLCELIAMSTHGRTGLVRGIVGSVTDKALRAAEVPVLVYRPPEDQEGTESAEAEPLLSLIVPLDGSEASERALPYAEELARRLSLEIVLAHAVYISPQAMYPGAGFYVDPTPIEEELAEDSERYLRGVAERLKSSGIRARLVVARDMPARAISELAKETRGSLIVMSSRGRSGITRMLLGSVTERVVRDSGSPVLVVPLLESRV